MGVVFGEWFKVASQELVGEKEFQPGLLPKFLARGRDAVQKRGQVNVGDKTMFDALNAACEEAQKLSDEPLIRALQKLEDAAQKGSYTTKDMIASSGRMKNLGVRSMGYIDPGSITVHLIFKSMREFVQ